MDLEEWQGSTCLVCGSEADHWCYRCNRPLCEEHTWYIRTIFTSEEARGIPACEPCFIAYEDRQAY